jgi:hypothetical protein
MYRMRRAAETGAERGIEGLLLLLCKLDIKKAMS